MEQNNSKPDVKTEGKPVKHEYDTTIVETDWSRDAQMNVMRETLVSWEERFSYLQKRQEEIEAAHAEVIRAITTEMNELDDNIGSMRTAWGWGPGGEVLNEDKKTHTYRIIPKSQIPVNMPMECPILKRVLKDQVWVHLTTPHVIGQEMYNAMYRTPRGGKAYVQLDSERKNVVKVTTGEPIPDDDDAEPT